MIVASGDQRGPEGVRKKVDSDSAGWVKKKASPCRPMVREEGKGGAFKEKRKKP